MIISPLTGDVLSDLKIVFSENFSAHSHKPCQHILFPPRTPSQRGKGSEKRVKKKHINVMYECIYVIIARLARRVPTVPSEKGVAMCVISI